MSDLDADVRRYDEDRWLASRFAPADVRARLIAIYALNHEIARTAEVVSTPALVDIRLTWWREAIDEVYAGKTVRSHPALVAFANAAAHVPDRWSDVIEARRGTEALESWPSIDAFIERTARAVMYMAMAAASVSDQDLERLTPQITYAALAWGHISLARSSWFASRAPGTLSESIERAEAAFSRIRSSGAEIPALAFPAIGYAALVPAYVRALRRGERERPLLLRQLKLITAAATGRL